jgi:hypothetical protein
MYRRRYANPNLCWCAFNHHAQIIWKGACTVRSPYYEKIIPNNAKRSADQVMSRNLGQMRPSCVGTASILFYVRYRLSVLYTRINSNRYLR